MKLVVVADGDPRDSRTNSGVARGLLTALEDLPGIDVVGVIDSTPSAWTRRLVMVLSWRPDRHHWRNQGRKGRLATWARSTVRDRKLRRIEGDIDLVLHVRNVYRPTRRPYVAFQDGTSSLSQRYWPTWQMSARDYRRRVEMERRYFERAILVATAGGFVAREIAEQYGIASGRVIAVGGGVNRTSSHLEAGGRTSRGFASGEAHFLFVGVNFERKGGHELLDAFEQLRSIRPDTALTIVGPRSVPPRPLPAGVQWLGFVSDRDEIARIYSDADIFCLPSRYEPYGLVIQEALAHGLPCIVSDRGALPEIVGRAGLVVAAEDVDALKAAMLELVDDAGLRKQLAEAADEELQGKTWNDVAARLIRGIRAVAPTGDA
jgi:glycosyltransferase involved in cell wall biosynthesis